MRAITSKRCATPRAQRCRRLVSSCVREPDGVAEIRPDAGRVRQRRERPVRIDMKHLAITLLVLVVACSGGPAPRQPAPPVPVPGEDTALRASRELQARCDQGDASSCYLAAAIVEVIEGDAARVRVLAERGHVLTREACTAADHEACRRIVTSIKLRFAATTDPAEQRALSARLVEVGTLGCHAGDLDVCLDVAAILHRGEAGAAEPARARELTEYACTRDYQPACVELALTLVDGTAGPADRARAEQLLEGACTKRDGLGCGQLAVLRLSGGPAAAAGAREAARHACELANAGGCAVLGHTLFEGIGGAKDEAGARTAFETACRGGDDRGCQMRARLGAR